MGHGISQNHVVGVLLFRIDLRHCERAHRNHLVRVKPIQRLERRKVFLDHFLVPKFYGFYDMGKIESVHVYHHWQRDLWVFRHPECVKICVVNFLAVFAEYLDPPRIPNHHGVGMVVPNGKGCAQGPVGQEHNHRQPHAGGYVNDLRHQSQSLGGCGRERSRPTAADPQQTLIAECSDSTGTNSASR